MRYLGIPIVQSDALLDTEKPMRRKSALAIMWAGVALTLAFVGWWALVIAGSASATMDKDGQLVVACLGGVPAALILVTGFALAEWWERR